MKFGLKTLLIAFAVTGLTVGWMSRLWIESPESFFQLLTIGTTVGPFVAAAVTIIVLGLRGNQPSRWVAVWGGLLLTMPMLGILAHWVLLPSGQPIRVLSSERLVETRLPGDLDSPWLWNELEYRLGRDQLNQPLAESAVGTLTAHMKRTSPTGWNQPLSWQRDFLAGARQRGLVSDDVWLELAEAFYGPEPQIQPISGLPPGKQYIPLQLEYGNPWQENSNLGVVLVWHVHAVALDGQPVTLQNVQSSFGRDWHGGFEATLAPGEHKLTVDVECALIDEKKLAGLDTNALPPNQWPEALKRWKVQVNTPLVVEPGSN
jgi:hypothetical protein